MAVFEECKTETDRHIMEKELNKISAISVGRPKKKLHTLFQKKFTKRSFEDARHVVVEISLCVRRELLTIHKLKLQWSMCEVVDFITVTRCHKCLGLGHTARFCQSKAKCSFCAGDHHRNKFENKHEIRCSSCTKATTNIHDESRKANTNYSVFSRGCPGYAGLNL